MLQTDRIKFPFQFEVKKLQEEVRSLVDLKWDGLLKKQDYGGGWSEISLTAKEGSKPLEQKDSIQTDDSHFEPIPYLQACPYILSILELFECDKYSVRLMKLSPGSETGRHLDDNLGKDEVRVLVPVFTNPLVTVLLNDSIVEMNEGECWYLKLSYPHNFRNEGKADLILLVLDLNLNEWIRDFLNC